MAARLRASMGDGLSRATRPTRDCGEAWSERDWVARVIDSLRALRECWGVTLGGPVLAGY